MNNLITVEEAGSLLDQYRTDLEPLVQENGKSFDRLKAVFLIAVQQEPKILQCTPESLRREISKCAADGLVPDSKEAVLLPYYDNKEKVLIANYQPMVHGVIKRMKELGGVFNIVCNLVHTNDEFVLDEADPDSLSHKTDRFSKDRGEVVGGYVIFRDEHKRVMHLETMSAEDFEKVRKASKAPESPAWKNWRDEMYKKAVLRRGAKYISVNNDKIRALIERQDDMFDFNQPRVAERINPFGGATDVIDHDDTKKIESKPQESVQVDLKARQEPDRQPAEGKNDPKGAKPAEDTSTAKKKADAKPSGPPAVPSISVDPKDHAIAVEGCEKILAIALKTDLTHRDRKGVLFSAADSWSKSTPEYLRPLMKACLDVSDWAIKQDADGKPWTGDHAMFVHGVKSLLGIEKLKIGSYP